ncbi:MAG: hypothetical protein J6T24_09395 [Clostridia bacterium]|nr:hypothetical protein [Clostridia bacterium]
MLYEIFSLMLAALGVYGAYALFSRLLALSGAGKPSLVSSGIHVECGFSEEEIYELLLALRIAPEGEAEPVLLIDCPLRGDVLQELSVLGARMYLSYEEYYHEKRKRTPSEPCDRDDLR